MTARQRGRRPLLRCPIRRRIGLTLVAGAPKATLKATDRPGSEQEVRGVQVTDADALQEDGVPP